MVFNKKIQYLVLSSLLVNILLSILLYIACIKTDIHMRLMAYLGVINYSSSGSRHLVEFRCLDGWANCISKLNVSCDVVFYGNSITYESNFQKYFPGYTICNLGCNRDDLDDLIFRSFIIRSVHPERIFIMGGINRFQELSLEEFEKKYNTLVDTISIQNPDSQIFLQSLLPVNISMEVGSRYADCREKIKEANRIIKNIADENSCIYIDLYSKFQVNDFLPEKFTRDGLHLYPEAYEIWATAISDYLK